ncbi:M16 family metallopeptidase [Roseibacillus ishigakijimensis]|uniref:Insulinase family protein n=1 Tax=Roseibacillus ishigakijimensis TaxID=454146 RepID=A0A934RNU5_9BACT|nr:pitrilysin family protein [Roseibacillus ishigakijimensis]MBK1834248.1 insulinase family protein [Roseibacillus ishigakijimensis]
MTFPATSATRHSLPCGLTVILDPNPTAPVVSAQIWVAAGSRREHEHAGGGISHLLEHMVFKGTKSFDVTSLAQSVQEKGGHWNAYTSFDRTVYYIDGPARSTNFFLQALTELVFFPSLPAEDFQTEKDVIRREIDMGLDDPDSVASQLLFATAFQHDHRRFPVIGHLDRFNRITHSEMVAYHAARYRPANAFLVLSGDFVPQEVLTHLEELTQDLDNLPVNEFHEQAEPPGLGKRVARQSFQTAVSHLNLAWPIPTLGHADCPALELLAQALGGGVSSPLYQRFREESGLTHQIGTWAWTPKDPPGLFVISAECEPEKRDKVESEVLAQLPAVVTSLTDEDLAKAYRQVAAAQFRSLTTASGRASDLGSNWHEARNLDLTRDYLAALEKVTLAQLKEVAARYLREDRLTLTSLDPEDKAPREFQVLTGTAAEPVSEHVLSNGLRVLLKRDSRIPSVFLQSPFLAGLPSEAMARAGLGQLHAATFLKGTARHSALAFNRSLESLGARLRLGTGNNTSLLSGFCLSMDLPQFLALAGESLCEPLFPEEAIAREKAAQRAAIEEAQEDPSRMAFYHLRRHLFGEQHYGIPKLGLAETLAILSREDVQAHHQRAFTARNGVFALYGDLPAEDEILPLLEDHLGKLPAGEALTFQPDTSAIPHQAGEHRHRLDREQAVLAMAVPGLSFDSPQAVAAELLQEHTSNMAGPLFTRIREELGLAYYVSSSQFHGIGTGMFATYLGTSPEQLGLAQRELTAALEKIAAEGLSVSEMERARTATLSSHALDEQSLSSQARQAALDRVLGLDLDHAQQNLAQLERITREEVNAFTRELLSQSTVTAIVEPPSQ